jgi:hypothetical protein
VGEKTTQEYSREETMRVLIFLLIIFSMTSVAIAGEIYGTITDEGKPVPAGIKVEVTVAGKTIAGETDKFGSYRVVATDKGKGTLAAYYKNQKPTADIFSYEKATRYDFIVETADGKLALKRK